MQADTQNTMLNGADTERKTMADRFHDALGVASVNDKVLLFAMPKPSRCDITKLSIIVFM